jgi:hypothetical protein
MALSLLYFSLIFFPLLLLPRPANVRSRDKRGAANGVLGGVVFHLRRLAAMVRAAPPAQGRGPPLPSFLLSLLLLPSLTHVRSKGCPCPWRPEEDSSGVATCTPTSAHVPVGECAVVEWLCSGALSLNPPQRNDDEWWLDLLPNDSGPCRTMIEVTAARGKPQVRSPLLPFLS